MPAVKPKTPKCPKCGARMVLKTTSRYTYPSGNPRKFFSCKNFPKCNGILAAHPNGNPASSPADWETRQLRILAHRLAEMIWGRLGTPECNSTAMYRWLERHTKAKHIGYMQKKELSIIIKKMYGRIKQEDIKTK